ncbi:MAG: hypothetical protein ACYS8X_10630 [Planctomycetota bacterium]|jgi:hypothetical protein
MALWSTATDDVEDLHMIFDTPATAQIAATDERAILREIAALPIQQERIALWKATNSLKPARGGCLEIIMKSTETFCHDPSRVTRWVETPRTLAAGAA